MTAFNELTERYTKLADAQLESLLSGDVPAQLLEPMRYSVFAGGKRLRPCLLLNACELCGGDAQSAVTLAAGIELIHTYSLIHDDLPCMDDDDYRRGRPSCHKRFGESFALLAGDGLLSLAFEAMLNMAVERGAGYTMAVREIARGAGVYGMVAGQADDLYFEDHFSDGYQTLKRIHERKTGALIRASVLAGAYAAGAGADSLRSLCEFADKFGLLFQITDDILDVEGSFEELGKTIGKDANENKLTYVNLFGLDKAKALAQNTAEEAAAALSAFGTDAEYLKALIDYTIKRKK